MDTTDGDKPIGSPQSDEEDSQTRMREKFKVEREYEEEPDKDDSRKKREREDRDDRARDEFGRLLRDKDRDSSRVSPKREKTRHSPKDERNYSRDSDRPPQSREREHSPPHKRGRRDSPPSSSWESRDYDGGSDRYGGRSSSGSRGQDFSSDRRPQSAPVAPPPFRSLPRPAAPSSGPRPIALNFLFDGPMKTYKQYLETQDDNITPSEAERKYEEYKSEFNKKLSRAFFRDHKNEEWFREKYEPTHLEARKKARDETARANAASFAVAFKEGNIKYSLDAESNIEEGEDWEEYQEVGAAGDHDEESKPSRSEHESPDRDDDRDSRSRSGKTMEPPRDPNTLFIKTIPPSCSRAELLAVLNKAAGPDRPCKLVLSEPMRFKNFHRIGWVTYKTKEDYAAAMAEVSGTRMKDFELQLAVNRPNTPETQQRKFKVTPPAAARESRIAHDAEQARKLAATLDAEKAISGNPVLEDSHWDSLTTVQRLDQIVYYLRNVHGFCYYCAEDFGEPEELLRKCGSIHMRGRNKGDSEETEKGLSWLKAVDNRINNRKPDDPDTYTGKNLTDKTTADLYADIVVKLEAEKFRCKLCNKLFRGEDFLRKHAVMKHEDSLLDCKLKGQEEQFFLNYFTDPRRIVPQEPKPTVMNRTPLPAQSQLHGSNHNSSNNHRPWSAGQQQHSQWEGNQRSDYNNFRSPQGRGSNNGGYRGQRAPMSNGGRDGGFRSGGLGNTPRPMGRRPLPIQQGSTFRDPRGIREYVDLDAPAEDVPVIDYRTQLDKHLESR